MLRSHSAFYKKTNNAVAIAAIFVSGIRTRRRDTFFCAAFRKYPKKRRLDCRCFLRSSVLPLVGREGVLPSYRRAASMPGPFGLIPTKPAVLSAANESKATLLRNVSYALNLAIDNLRYYSSPSAQRRHLNTLSSRTVPLISKLP